MLVSGGNLATKQLNGEVNDDLFEGAHFVSAPALFVFIGHV